MRAYLFAVLVSIDQLVNTLLAGDPDETISSRVGKAALKGEPWALLAQTVLDWVFLQITRQPFHCLNSIEADENT